MEVIDKRKIDADGNAKPSDEQYDSFRPKLQGFEPVFDVVLLRELKIEDDSLIVSPDAYAEPTLYGEVVAVSSQPHDFLANHVRSVVAPGDIVRYLKAIGTTIEFDDTKPGQRYLTLSERDIIGKWRA